MEILILLLALFTKHLVVDFFLQGPFMWKNKGNIWHLGGYAHAGLHAAVTFIAYPCCNPCYCACNRACRACLALRYRLEQDESQR